jgi:hypothetical protein
MYSHIFATDKRFVQPALLRDLVNILSIVQELQVQIKIQFQGHQTMLK